MDIKYMIRGDESEFFTLKDAKFHIYIAYTNDERLKMINGSSIIKYVNGEPKTETPIIVDGLGKYKFGKTKKL